MQMSQCEEGHFYNSRKYSKCPYCSGESDLQSVFAPVERINQTVEISRARPTAGPQTVLPHGDASRTMAVIQQETGMDPVVGWLICMSGQDRGVDFRLHADNNFIGRDERMDICLRKDIAVSRNNHAVVSFDMKSGKFYLSISEGRSIIRLNGEPVFSKAELSAFDEIEIGTTKLMFYPLCSDKFSWNGKKSDNNDEKT